MQNNRPTVDSFVHMWNQLSRDQRRALLNPDNLARVKQYLNGLAQEETARTFFVPLSDEQAVDALIEQADFRPTTARAWVQQIRRRSVPGSLAWTMRAGYDVEQVRSSPCWSGELPDPRRLYNCSPTCAGLVFWNPGMSTPSLMFRDVSATKMPWLGERFGAFRTPDLPTLVGLLEAWVKQSGRTVRERLLTATHTGAVTGETYVIELNLDGGKRYCGRLEELDAPGIQDDILVIPVIVVPYKRTA